MLAAGNAAFDARTGEHRLAERRFARRRMTKPGKIPKVPRRRRGHKLNLFLL
jgi:hypothetical protein